jgi:hypothetical protein
MYSLCEKYVGPPLVMRLFGKITEDAYDFKHFLWWSFVKLF